MDANPPTAEAESRPVEAPSHEDPWAAVAGLQCKLSVDLSVSSFKVRDLLRLDVETVVDSHHNSTSHVPVWVNGVRVGWAEFDVLRTRLAIRISELG
ncbi:MAG: FliM/FliN family flagellar motor switch protein [Terriglobia bacterium]